MGPLVDTAAPGEPEVGPSVDRHIESASLTARLAEVSLRESHRLARRIEHTRRVRDRQEREQALQDLGAEIDRAAQRLQNRRASVPAITYPADLPVSQRRDDLLAAIGEHQVVIVAGETGSGKTTQLPKMALELGRGVRGLIGHTQPRRIAARTVAERIAEELDTPLGDAVGYTVRFTDRVGDDTLVRVMTDGILLAEIQRDRMLARYDTLIIDEAHERSLNVDFILGYLKQLLPQRPDLKVIITSATIETGRFSRHFGDAPVIEVSGRTFPVEVRYRPVVEEDGDSDSPTAPVRDQTQAVCDAVGELQAAGPGDVLVFLSGEREIRDTADALRAMDLRNTEVLPLYARLSAAEQHRVFEPHPGKRVVLATNVAETSLTVPGIRYVVDPGTARISRYSHRTKVQRLPIEAISQASANQRKGRCGRTSDGICIRLYSEEDFLARPEFTDPEILRTNLASVILSMTALGLGDVAAFPFVDPPDRRNVRDGVDLLQELGAFDPAEEDPHRRLTPLGRKLAQLPVDPRLARMILEADRNGCVREVMILAAALSIQDVRERPVDKAQAADEKHARFTDKTSDFLTYLNLWSYLQQQQKELSSSAFRRLCKAEFLHYLRVREWQDLFGQLRSLAAAVGVSVSTLPADPQRIHLSLLAGLLSHLGLKDVDKNDYLGARGARFAIFPGSALFKKPPRWVMAAELVETSRLYARVTARIEPEWAEQLAGHLVKRSYSEPHWEKDRGAVMAYEKVLLYGLPLVAGRKVAYGRIDPEVSRDLFIRHALVEGDWRTHHAFFGENRQLLEDVEDLENRARRRDIVVDDEALYDFYDQRIPADVVSGRHFDSWWKKARRTEPDLLSFERSMLINDSAQDVSERDYPDIWRQGSLELPLSYQFEPGAAADGVTVHIPLAVLNQVTSDGFDWQVPGLRAELMTALIRTLPKALRRHFVPAPDRARAVLAQVPGSPETSTDVPLIDFFGRELRRGTGVEVPREAWAPHRVPDHLRMTFSVEDELGRPLGAGKDLQALRHVLLPRVRAEIGTVAPDLEAQRLRDWTIGDLPHTVESARGGHVVKGYPALIDAGDSVAVHVFGTETEQREAMAAGTRRLLLLSLPGGAPSMQALAGRLTNPEKLALSRSPYPGVAALLADCVTCAVDDLVAAQGGPAWDAAGFAALRERVRAELDAAVTDVVRTVAAIGAAAGEVEQQLRSTTSLTVLPAVSDIRDQLSELVFPGFVGATGRRRLPDLLRYLRAIIRRLERLAANPDRDRERMAKVQNLTQAYRRTMGAQPPGRPVGPELAVIRWMLEELRVSLFAQALGTPFPVSEQRITRALAQVSNT
jgi:ATP-dependent helicase HrpA